MNIKEVLDRSEEYLKKHDISTPRLDSEVLLADLLGMERIKLYVNYDYPLKSNELDEFRTRIKKRAERLPAAYITGKKEFMSLELMVNEGVLLPRPETENLVEEVIEFCETEELSAPHIVDVGTGSGAIMVSLGYYLKESRILGIDISRAAVQVARENIKKYELETRLKVIRGDLLNSLIKRGKANVDIVVSNPPYIRDSMMKKLPPEVKKEPRRALEGGDKGLDYYTRLIPQARKVLNRGGVLMLEIGSQQADDVGDMLAEWKKVEVIKDNRGQDRIIRARIED